MKRLSILIALFLITGCMKAEIVRLDPTPRPARPVDSIQVLTIVPSEPHETIGFVVVDNRDNSSIKLEAMMKRVMDEAAALGGEAVIVSLEDRTSGGAIVPVQGVGLVATKRHMRQVSATVIVWRRQ